MFERLTVHIGHQKTGTTSLQQTFRTNAGRLADAGLFYWDGAPDHHELTHAFSERLRRRIVRGDFARFIAAAAEAKVPHALVSSEVFVLLEDDEVAAFAAAMQSLARDIRIVLYVRHPVATVASCVHQSLRHGRTLDQTFQWVRPVPVDAIVTRWSAVFGAGAFTIRPYDRTAFPGGCVIDDMLDTLGITPEPLKKVRRNDGFSVLGAHLLDRALRKSGERFPRPILEAFEAIEGPRYVPPQAVLDEAAAAGAPQLAFLATRGISLPDPALTPTSPPPYDEATLDRMAAATLQSAEAKAATLKSGKAKAVHTG